jgi:hypothetical protein
MLLDNSELYWFAAPRVGIIQARPSAALQFLGYACAAQRAASVSRLVPHALVSFPRPEDFLTVGESDPHPLADSLWFSASESLRRCARRECRRDDVRRFQAASS